MNQIYQLLAKSRTSKEDPRQRLENKLPISVFLALNLKCSETVTSQLILLNLSSRNKRKHSVIAAYC